MTNISKKRGPVDDLYEAEFLGQTVQLFAASLAQARQRAVEHFKPKKRDADRLNLTMVG